MARAPAAVLEDPNAAPTTGYPSPRTRRSLPRRDSTLELMRVESRDLPDAHEMFLAAPGPPLTEAVRQ